MWFNQIKNWRRSVCLIFKILWSIEAFTNLTGLMKYYVYTYTKLHIIIHSHIYTYIYIHMLHFFLSKIHLNTKKLWNIITIWNNCFLFEYMLNCHLFLWSKLYFPHHYSSLQCRMIFRNHSYADLLLSYYCSSVINNGFCCLIFCGLFSFIYWSIYLK